jgi:hypothetical protein
MRQQYMSKEVDESAKFVRESSITYDKRTLDSFICELEPDKDVGERRLLIEKLKAREKTSFSMAMIDEEIVIINDLLNQEIPLTVVKGD